MNQFDDLAAAMQEFAAMETKMQQLQTEAFDSMREVIATRRFGGVAEVIDPEQIVRVSTDEFGAVSAIQIGSDWREVYSAAELSQVITACAQQAEQVRTARAQQHLEEHPDALADITDEQIAAEFHDAPQQSRRTSTPEETILEISERMPELEEQAFEIARSSAGSIDALEQGDPVQIVSVAGMLVTVRVSPEFIERASNVQLNAALTQAVYDHNHPEEQDDDQPKSVHDQLRADSVDAYAAAQALMQMFQSSQK